MWQVDVICRMLGLSVDTANLDTYSMRSKEQVDSDMNEGIGKVSLTNLLKNQNVVGHYGTSDVSTEIIAYEK